MALFRSFGQAGHPFSWVEFFIPYSKDFCFKTRPNEQSYQVTEHIKLILKLDLFFSVQKKLIFYAVDFISMVFVGYMVFTFFFAMFQHTPTKPLPLMLLLLIIDILPCVFGIVWLLFRYYKPAPTDAKK